MASANEDIAFDVDEASAEADMCCSRTRSWCRDAAPSTSGIRSVADGQVSEGSPAPPGPSAALALARRGRAYADGLAQGLLQLAHRPHGVRSAVSDGEPAAARQAKVLARAEVLIQVHAIGQVAHARTSPSTSHRHGLTVGRQPRGASRAGSRSMCRSRGTRRGSQASEPPSSSTRPNTLLHLGAAPTRGGRCVIGPAASPGSRARARLARPAAGPVSSTAAS
jgi:hypothetical protein